MIERGKVASFTIRVNGALAPEEFMADVNQVIVDTDGYLPDMFSVRVADRDMIWVDSEVVAVGMEVEILAKALVNPATRRAQDLRLVKGEVTALEPEFAAGGNAALVIRGYDRSHRLGRGRKSRSFLRSTDGEIARKIAKELSLQAEVDSTPTVHDYVFQHNQSDLEFLTQRAERIGFQVEVDDRTLLFRRADQEQEAGPVLTWRSNLYSFHPRLTVAGQAEEVVVRGWDPAAKKEIIGRARVGHGAPRLGLKQPGAEIAQQAFQKPAQAVVVDHPVASMDEANAMAQALLDEISGEFIQADGVCQGDPRVRAGARVRIGGLGKRFSGVYYVTAATHTLSADGKYETAFRISGRQPGTLSRLLERGNGDGPDREWVRGVVIGVVTNTRDPDGLGRVKVRYPWLADNEESPWVRVTQSGGLVHLPEINQEVLVAFEHGDIHRPYVLGMLHNGKDRPPVPALVGRDGKVRQRSLRSRTGHEVTLDDSDDKASIIIRDRSGQNQIVIDSIKNDMSIRVKGNLTIEADGRVNIVSKNNLTLEARGRGEIRANGLNLNGGPKVEIRGGMIHLN